MKNIFICLVTLFLIFTSNLSFAQKLVTTYAYSSDAMGAAGIAAAAKAFFEGSEQDILGEAEFIDIGKCESNSNSTCVKVRETHYSYAGNVIYEAISKYSTLMGEKVSEEPVRGQKRYHLFDTWPVGLRGF